MKIIPLVLSASLAFSAATPGWAAAVVSTSGTSVSAITPQGRVGVAIGNAVDSRTRIVVARGRPGHDTVLRYDDGCEVRLRPGAVYTVLDESPCASQAARQQPAEPAPEPTGLGTTTAGIGTTAVVGALVVGGIAAGIVAATSSKGSTTPPYISP